jgi:transposase-like protein
MSKKPRVQRTPEEKWHIVLETLKSGNVAETCRKYEIAPNLYYRWKDEVEAEGKTVLGGRGAAAQPDVEQGKRIKQLERAGRIALADRDLRKRAGRVSCGQALTSNTAPVHGQERDLLPLSFPVPCANPEEEYPQRTTRLLSQDQGQA